MEIQRIQGLRWRAPCVRVALELQTGGVQEPLLIEQLVRPHDVEEGRAKRLQGLAGISNLT